MEKKDIAYITIQVGDQTVYRTFTTDYLRFGDAITIGETVQDMFDNLDNSDRPLSDEEI